MARCLLPFLNACAARVARCRPGRSPEQRPTHSLRLTAAPCPRSDRIPKRKPHDRRLHLRRDPHPARQGPQGRQPARGHGAAPLRRRAQRHQGAQQHRRRRRRGRDLGQRHPGRRTGRLPRPLRGADVRHRPEGAGPRDQPLLRLRPRGGEPRRQPGPGRRRRRLHRRRRRDDEPRADGLGWCRHRRRPRARDQELLRPPGHRRRHHRHRIRLLPRRLRPLRRREPEARRAGLGGKPLRPLGGRRSATSTACRSSSATNTSAPAPTCSRSAR